MTHFRLRKADDLDGKSWDCDDLTVTGALAILGQQLGLVLALDGDICPYVMDRRETDGSEPDFKKSSLIGVCVTGAASN